jgi:hypothetical protein
MLGKLLGFSRMHENKIFFFYFERGNLIFQKKKLEIFWRKPGILIPDLYLIV